MQKCANRQGVPAQSSTRSLAASTRSSSGRRRPSRYLRAVEHGDGRQLPEGVAETAPQVGGRHTLVDRAARGWSAAGERSGRAARLPEPPAEHTVERQRQSRRRHSSLKSSLPIQITSVGRAARRTPSAAVGEKRELADGVATPELAHHWLDLSCTTSSRPVCTTNIASPASPSRNSHSLSRRAASRPATSSRRAASPRTAERGRGSPPAPRTAVAGGFRCRTPPDRAARARGPGHWRRNLHGQGGVAKTAPAQAPPGTPRQPLRANMHAAPNVQASSNAAAASAGEGVPVIAMTRATPRAAPTGWATEFSPVAVAKSSPGAEATAAALRFGNVVPAPSPSRTMPEPLAAKAGVVPTRYEPATGPAPQMRPPATSHVAMADSLGIAGRAGHGGGDERAGVRASPASSAE